MTSMLKQKIDELEKCAMDAGERLIKTMIADYLEYCQEEEPIPLKEWKYYVYPTEGKAYQDVKSLLRVSKNFVEERVGLQVTPDDDGYVLKGSGK